MIQNGYIEYIKDDRPDLDLKSTEILGSYGVSPEVWEEMRFDRYNSELEQAVESIEASKFLLDASMGQKFSFRGVYKMLSVLLAFGILLTPSLLLMVSFSKIQEIFLVVFLHFLGLGACVLTLGIWRIEPDTFYMIFTLLLMIAALVLRKNSKITRIVFFMLLIAIPGTVWVVGLNSINLGEDWILISVVSFAFTIFFTNLMSKRLSKPK